MQSLPWIVALAALAVLGLGLGAWLITTRQTKRQIPLPVEWGLAPRAVFSKDERRVYRLLREALPHHVVLAKLPLVRLCQPTDSGDMRYWYELLGSLHVSFAICTSNGRVLAVIDLESEQPLSRRALLIKQSVLNTCRIRYLRSPIDQLPTAAELQLLVPQTSASSRAPQPAAASRDLHEARDSLANTVATRRAERGVLWQDSTVFQDSFFAPDSRHDTLSGAELPRPPADLPDDDVGGVVVEAPRFSSNGR